MQARSSPQTNEFDHVVWWAWSFKAELSDPAPSANTAGVGAAAPMTGLAELPYLAGDRDCHLPEAGGTLENAQARATREPARNQAL